MNNNFQKNKLSNKRIVMYYKPECEEASLNFETLGPSPSSMRVVTVLVSLILFEAEFIFLILVLRSSP